MARAGQHFRAYHRTRNVPTPRCRDCGTTCLLVATFRAGLTHDHFAGGLPRDPARLCAGTLFLVPAASAFLPGDRTVSWHSGSPHPQ
ncbi:hypothetical protein SAMN02745121_02021 [Nannocystis exedens]|uniref:Uncharacterized protein n=1 Tax=Nannocystis exedens TaxID=54 RepID=A0A1I1W1P3_9BACT|nr:hypothetical protein SAMN02745121_02021 [Nannocystis exedens]